MRAQLKLLIGMAALVCAAPVAHADVVISSQATENMSCSDGVCSPTASSAVLNVRDLDSMLASANIKVTTKGASVQADNIRLDAPLTWSSTSALALDAYQSIFIGKAVTVASVGGLTIATNNGGNNGTFSFGEKGRVIFKNRSSALTINGQSFALVDSLPSLAAAVANNSSGAYALANNYNASKDGTYTTSPISTLVGTIEGLGNTISRLSIVIQNAPAFTAMVEVLDQAGVIENLHLDEVNIQADGETVAALVGQNNGNIFDDSATGSVDATGTEQLAGGLVAANTSMATISSSWVNVRVTASNNAGAGGLVGQSFGTIKFTHAEGAVNAASAGGLVGGNEGAISQSFATSAVYGAQAGGLVGINDGNGTYAGTISDSYATGNVSGGVGGFVGDQSGDAISTSYSTGTVSGGGGFGCTGSAIQVSNDYWDVTTSGTSYGWCYDLNLDGTTGLTSKQLRSGLPSGFSPSIWAEKKGVNHGFPYLIANPPAKK